MAGSNINRVVLTGNLTRDPELRTLPSDISVCTLRIASNTRRRDEHGQWGEKANFFDVTVWGAQGEACARFLSKGRPVAIDGRLAWREYETRSTGARGSDKRQVVEIVAEHVQFLTDQMNESGSQSPERGTSRSSLGDRSGSQAPISDDDIPF
jgi:single-strand DNA-binding protein